jgi:hypothetical protein
LREAKKSIVFQTNVIDSENILLRALSLSLSLYVHCRRLLFRVDSALALNCAFVYRTFSAVHICEPIFITAKFIS